MAHTLNFKSEQGRVLSMYSQWAFSFNKHAFLKYPQRSEGKVFEIDVL